jgi:hypothetical protein
VCCGATHLAHLTIDHVNDDGKIERLTYRTPKSLYVRLRQEGYPPGYQLMCFNCNAAKHIEGGCTCQQSGDT